MNRKQNRSLNKVALISTPWPLYSRPSVQLGTLKAHLNAQFPDLLVETHHYYLKLAETIGYKLYHDISERTWMAESIYASLLYPNRWKQIEKLLNKETKRKSLLKEIGLKALSNQVKKTTNDFIDSTDWGSFQLAGFSVSLCQLTSALYFIKAIKQTYQKIITVIGGSTFSGNTAPSLLNLFPEVDVVIIGEGELSLSQLIHHLRRSKIPENLPSIQGVYTQNTTAVQNDHRLFSQMESLDSLSIPDYDDYFELLKSFHPQKSFFPTLPIEISRGCWWKPTSQEGKVTGCAFCNLNLQWKDYRSKEPSQVVSEVDDLTAKHKTLSVAIMDNVLPTNTSREIFERLATLKKDLRLFSEIRATTPLSELKVMRAAGMHEVQVGIEALSTSLLKKLHKGTTAIQNLEIMKNCEMLGIANISNLILHFPGSDEQEVNESLRNLEFATPYRPLNVVNFWLGLESPVWQNPTTYGIKAVFNHQNWSYLFPPEIYKSMPFMIQAYRGDLGYQKKIWQPVKKKVKVWLNTYNELHKGPSQSPILSFRDGRDFLIIRQRRFQAEPIMHRLVGTSRLIYLFCQHHRSLRRLRAQFKAISEDKLLAFLKMMVDKKLMFTENDKYLSLAMPVKSKNMGLISKN
jgi:ribosomal peptide maturation radical SAM protein 1